jgi:hypothetical protein
LPRTASRTSGSTEATTSPTRGGGPPFCMVVDWVVAAIIVGEIAAGMDFG